MCVVELVGKERLITSCNNVAEEGMVIFTNSPKVRKDRRTNVELILSQHDCQCVTCARSGCCSLQKIANDLNIIDIPYRRRSQALEHGLPADPRFGKVYQMHALYPICDKVQKLSVWDVEGPARGPSQCVRAHEYRGCSLLPVRTVHHPLPGGSPA